jgi:hypothetical protein
MDIFSNAGKLLILSGIIIIFIGFLLAMSNHIPLLGKLPGDIIIEKKNFKFYFPLTSSIILSIILSFIFSLLGRR